MIKVILFISLLISSSFCFTIDDNAFITKYEYGKMLYNNPRGIGCVKCHGSKAQGKVIVEFDHIYRNKKYKCKLKTPSIRNIDYKNFFKKVNGKDTKKKTFKSDEVCQKLIFNADIMPTYFLVEEEIEAIYHYINNLKD